MPGNSASAAQHRKELLLGCQPEATASFRGCTHARAQTLSHVSAVSLVTLCSATQHPTETCLDHSPTAHGGVLPRQLAVCLPAIFHAGSLLRHRRSNQSPCMTLTVVSNAAPRCRPILSASKTTLMSFKILSASCRITLDFGQVDYTGFCFVFSRGPC